jgi:hypothetical protein
MLLPLHINNWPDYYFPGGGGFKSKRTFTWAPETPKKKKKIILKSDVKELTPERKLLKLTDIEFEQKRLLELKEILEVLREAISIGSKVTLMGYRYVSPKDLREVERKVQEEEEILLLLEII